MEQVKITEQAVKAGMDFLDRYNGSIGGTTVPEAQITQALVNKVKETFPGLQGRTVTDAEKLITEIIKDTKNNFLIANNPPVNPVNLSNRYRALLRGAFGATKRELGLNR